MTAAGLSIPDASDAHIVRPLQMRGKPKGGFILPTASSALSRFAALSRAAQKREKALAAYLFILPTPPPARVNAR